MSVYTHRQDFSVCSHSSKEDEIAGSDSVPAQMHGVWLWWSCIKRQHLSLWAFYWRSFYIHRNGELKWYHTFTSVIPPSLLQMHLYPCTGCIHMSVWKIPTNSSSSSDTILILLLEKDCKILLVTLIVHKSAFYWQLFIFLLSSTHERGWGIEWQEEMCSRWPWGGVCGFIFHFLAPHRLIPFIVLCSLPMRNLSYLLPRVSLWPSSEWLLLIHKLWELCRWHLEMAEALIFVEHK